jgi:predicted lipid-binding transport protein (Tim44 family)
MRRRHTSVSYFRWVQTLAKLAALTAALLVGAEDADARLPDGLSFGEPGAVISSPAIAGVEVATAQHARVTAQVGPYPGGSLSGLFNRGGLLGGFAAGFLGAGLLGLLFGRGLFGELGSVPSYLGLIVQLALLALLCRLIWTRWHGGDAAAAAVLSPRQLADPYLRSRDDLHAGHDPSATMEDAVEVDAEPGARGSGATPHRRRT